MHDLQQTEASNFLISLWRQVDDLKTLHTIIITLIFGDEALHSIIYLLLRKWKIARMFYVYLNGYVFCGKRADFLLQTAVVVQSYKLF